MADRVRVSRFLRRTGSSRRRVSWGLGPLTNGAQVVTSAGSTLFATNAQTTLDDLTLVRLRGEFAMWLEVVGSIGDGFSRVGLGFCVVTENAAGIGISAVPSPLADIGWDGWFYHRVFAPIFGFSVTESENTGPVSQVRTEIDSKAMRKTHLTDVVVGVLETAGEVGVASLAFGAETRMLFKLP